jgi:hypothetical protein
MRKILALTVKPSVSPDTRYRILQYFDHIRESGLIVHHFSLLDERSVKRFQTNSDVLCNAAAYLKSCLKRMAQIIRLAPRYDIIWILRELMPVGPPILEKLLFRLHSDVVLDIDDAVFFPDIASGTFIHNRLRDFNKWEKTASAYRTVVCGNRYLASYFRRWGAKAIEIVPTVVCMKRYESVKRIASEIPRIGWVGMPTNRAHLKLLEGVFHRLAERFKFKGIVVGLNRCLDWKLDCMEYFSWELSRELAYFDLFDIGIMPLADSEFTRGKCAFKIIQYMAAGIPVVASPVGANTEVIRHGINGYLAHSESEWENILRCLLTDSDLRERIGRQGRETVRKQYSLEAWGPRYVNILGGKIRNG